MMNKTIIFLLMFCATSFAQQKFEMKSASKIYNARIEVERCAEGTCDGELKIELFRKSARQPFQIINLDATEFAVEETEMTNSKRMYDYQSILFFEDYNFDGIEDLSIRDGNNSGYGGPSYQTYLYSPRVKKFIYSQPFTDLGQGEYLGMFEVDRKRKILRAFSKSGCCLHRTDEFIVAGNRPKKVFEETEDATIPDEKRVRITTRRFVKGRWRTTVKYVKREQ